MLVIPSNTLHCSNVYTKVEEKKPYCVRVASTDKINAIRMNLQILGNSVKKHYLAWEMKKEHGESEKKDKKNRVES